MTSLTTALARAVGRARLGPGTNLVVTSLDHDANVTPWTTVAEETGTEVGHKYKKSRKGQEKVRNSRFMVDLLTVSKLSHRLHLWWCP